MASMSAAYNLAINVGGKADTRHIQQAGKDVQGFGSNLKGMAKGAGVAFAAVATAATVAYKAIEEGAALDAARQKFDNLAESIGTTSGAMLGSLREATRGMVSDAELITSATDIINLGLANNEEGVTRLATVISGLGLDMQQVILTFANNSKARLDALGLSVEGVTNKAAELEAQGFEGDAFDEAVLISLEEKMSLFGDASETTAGQLAILKASAQNAKDEVLLFLQSIAAPVIENLAKSTSGYQQQLHKTALELASTTNNYEDMKNIINENFGAGEDLFKQAEEMGLAFVDLGHGQSIWIEDLEKAAGISIPRFGQELAKLSQMAQEYSVVTGTSAVGAASDYGAELARLSQMGQEAAAAQRLLKEETDAAQQAMNASMVGALNDLPDAYSTLITAQQQLEDSQGEWVQTTVDNAGRIGSVNAQLAADLSDEQAAAMRDILNTVDEGSAEWLNAYNALQGDLSKSQRDALVAQKAELEAANGSMGSAYTGSIEDAKAAQEAIDAANAEIIASYRELAVEGALALAELSPDPDAIQRTLDYAVAIGEMTQAEADMRLEAAQARLAIEDLNEMVVNGQISAEQAGRAFDLLANGQYNTAASAVEAGDKQQRLIDLFNETPQKVQTAYTLLTGDSISRLQAVRDLLNQVDGRNASSTVTVNTATAADLGSSDGSKQGTGKASGGPVFPNTIYPVGEGNKPELLQQNGRMYLIPGDRGQVFSNQQSQGAMGGGPKIEININGMMLPQNPRTAGAIIAGEVAERLGVK